MFIVRTMHLRAILHEGLVGSFLRFPESVLVAATLLDSGGFFVMMVRPKLSIAEGVPCEEAREDRLMRRRLLRGSRGGIHLCTLFRFGAFGFQPCPLIAPVLGEVVF